MRLAELMLGCVISCAGFEAARADCCRGAAACLWACSDVSMPSLSSCRKRPAKRRLLKWESGVFNRPGKSTGFRLDQTFVCCKAFRRNDEAVRNDDAGSSDEAGIDDEAVGSDEPMSGGRTISQDGRRVTGRRNDGRRRHACFQGLLADDGMGANREPQGVRCHTHHKDIDNGRHTSLDAVRAFRHCRARRPTIRRCLSRARLKPAHLHSR